jgi:plastocyanin
MSDQQPSRMTTQAFGLTLMAVVMAIVVVISFVVLDGDEVGMFLVVTLLAGAAAFVVWRFNALWARILGLVATIGIGLFTFWFAFGVFQLFSPLEFITGLGYVLGLLFALIGGIVGLFKKGASSAMLRRGALVLIGVASLVSVVGFYATRSTVSDADAAAAIALNMEDFEFGPASLSVAAGDQLLLINSDLFAHDLTLEEGDVYVHLGPGGESLVDLGDLPAGTYEYFCSLHSFEEDGVKEGMVGTITVGP